MHQHALLANVEIAIVFHKNPSLLLPYHMWIPSSRSIWVGCCILLDYGQKTLYVNVFLLATQLHANFTR